MEDAFLSRIADEPDDVAARLVFADWLREQGDPALQERGEFIHIQHALWTGSAHPDLRPGLTARQKELLGRHRARWEESFRHLVRSCEYRLGFPERVTLTAEQFAGGFAELNRLTPVVRVRISGLTPDTVGAVAAAGSLARLRELDLGGRPTPPQVLRDLLASPRLARLRSLNLARTGVGDEGVRALVASDAFRRLRYLNLSRAGVTASGVRALVGAIYNRPVELRNLVLNRVPRLEPGAFPPVPRGLPFPLRLSLHAQLGLGLAPQNLLDELHANRPGLSAELRRWVEWLRQHGESALPRAVKQLPLPDAVRQAFTHACRRRVVWRADRLGDLPPALPLDADGSDDLAGIVTILIGMADPGKESSALAECLLDLYARHEQGELPPDGRTR